MIKISNVLQRDHPLTRQENWICQARFFAMLYPIGIVILSVYILVTEGLCELIRLFTSVNLISIDLVLIPLFILSHFLSGYRYLKNLNLAIEHGICFEGVIIERRHRRTRYQVFYQFGVGLDNGLFVDTPIYKEHLDRYKYCDVYLYKKKYYFTDYRFYETI